MKVKRLLQIFCLFVGVAGASSIALAVDVTGVFELDGNAASLIYDDWQTLNSPGYDGPAIAITGVRQDMHVGVPPDPTAFFNKQKILRIFRIAGLGRRPMYRTKTILTMPTQPLISPRAEMRKAI